jgi:hypothetical protein
MNRPMNNDKVNNPLWKSESSDSEGKLNESMQPAYSRRKDIRK